ncbi:MAG TPA: HAD family hydrolase [Cellulomonas sp.]|nr:HAD family hydrolase [Cellulomonas sp.]
MPTLPAAVLWDMDGTLINTEPLWIGAETDLVTAHGGVWTHEDGLSLVGNPMALSAETLRNRGVDLPVEQIVDHLNVKVAAGVAAATPWQPGARELLDELAAAGVPMALVTSSYQILSEPFAAVAGCFDVIVSGDTVTNPKPDPEPYLTAAAQLGVPIEQCVAVEDSRAGIASALASGARTVGVEVFQPIAPRPGLVRVTDLRELDVQRFAEIAAGAVPTH